VVGRPGELQPIGALLAAAERGTGVVDQDVDVTVPVPDLSGDPADVGLHGQAGHQQHRRFAGCGPASNRGPEGDRQLPVVEQQTMPPDALAKT
jgi:hypothetical protein